MTAWRRIQRSQQSNLYPGKLIVLFKPKHLRLLLLDAKHFRIHKFPFTLYVALDGVERKPIAWILLPRTELRAGYDLILRYLKQEKINIDAIISDWHKSIIASVNDNCELAIHQRCTAHVLQEIYRKLSGRKFLRTGHGKEIWPIMRKIALGFETYLPAYLFLQAMKIKYPEYRRAFKYLGKCLPDIYQFARKPKLKIHRTSNLIENFMGILEQRLKTMRGLKTPETLIKFITNLIIIKYK